MTREATGLFLFVLEFSRQIRQSRLKNVGWFHFGRNIFMRYLALLAPIFILFAVVAVSVPAQEITPANLPADTSLVIYSHSRDKIQAAVPSNPMVKAWYSPEYAQIRTLLVQYFIGQMTPKPGAQKIAIAPQNIDRMLSVLQNSLVIGFSSTSDIGVILQSSGNSAGQLLRTPGLFFILDTTGKEAEFTQAWPALVAALPREITHTKYDFAGTSVEKFAGPNQTTFAARLGNRFVWSNQQTVLEDLIGRLKPGAPTGNSLAENPDFQHCQVQPAPAAVVHFFYRFPDFSKIPVPANPQVDTGAMVKAMHLDSIHAICGNIAMTQDAEFSQWQILADTSPGSLLSWFGSNHAQFDTAALATSSTSSITVGTFDLQAFYKTLKSAVVAAMPGRQQASADLMEGMASMQLGMPITDALGLIRGEFASINTKSQAADPPGVVALTISNPKQIVDLIQKLVPSEISDESQENGVTFFKTPAILGSEPNKPASDYFALTPQFLLVSSDRQVLHDFAARAGSDQTVGGGASIVTNPDVRRLRAMMPAEVLGFSITDYSNGGFQKQMTKAFADMQSQDKSKTTPEELQLLQALSQIPWANFMGGIHWGVSAWWKNADGIHIESRMQ
jgi:hypothetical protein